jgi:hypothetical protein
MLLIETAVAPLLVNVVLSGALTVPTAALPNLRLVGLTAAATLTVSFFDLVMPFAVPAMVTEVLARTTVVVTSNDCDCTPCGTTMLAAIGLATAALLVDRSTVIGPGPALHSSVAVPVSGCPPTTEVGVRLTDRRPIGRTVMARLSVAPFSVAFTLPLSGAETAEVLIVNFLDVAPSGTTTDAGLLADVSVSDSVTVTPPAPAGCDRPTVPETLLQPAIVALPSVRLLKALPAVSE